MMAATEPPLGLLLAAPGTQVLLVGSGTYPTGSRLPDVPAVPGTISDLGQCLVDRAGLDPADLTVLIDPSGPQEFGAALVRAAQRARAVLFVYYLGHGLVGSNNDLHLATRSTVDLTEGIPSHQALPYSVVREVVAGSPARLTLIALDCCFAGRAQGTTGRADIDQVFDTARQGMYLLTSTNRNEAAWAPEGQRHTAFTGALIHLLTNGDPTAPPLLTLDDLYRSLSRTLPARGFPRPRRQAADYGDRQPIVPNPAYRSRSPEDPREQVGDFSPYRGLAAFGPEDAGLFFGRTDLITALVDRVTGHPSRTGPLVVIGPSGSGKSSLLRAGLVPALQRGSHSGETGTRFMILNPGDDPVGTLAKRFAVLGDSSPEEFRRRLQDQPGHLREALVRILGDRTERPVIIVDQFEEVFTACPDEHQRRIFVEALHSVSVGTEGDAPAVVVIGVRADFYGHCTAHPELLSALDHPLVVGPMTTAQLSEAVEGPAALTGLILQDGLVDLLLEDLGTGAQLSAMGMGGVLPLLSHALLATWQNREGRTLTLAGYRETGGIARSLAQTADTTLRGLDSAGHRIARRLLPRLVRLGEDTESTRRTIPLADLLPPAASPGHVEARQVLDHFVHARLVTVDEDSVQLTHEALIRAWPQLRLWIEEDRATLLVLQQLGEDAREWAGHDRDPAFLYQGTRLLAAQQARTRWEGDSLRHHVTLTVTEQAFLDAGSALMRRQGRQRRLILAVLSGLLVVALAAAGLAESQRRVADEQTTEAVAQRDRVVASLVAARAGVLRPTDPVNATLLSIASWRLGQVPEARGSLYEALDQLERSVVTVPGAVVYELNRDGTELVTFGPDGGGVWDAATGRRLRTLSGSGPDVTVPMSRGASAGRSFKTVTLSPDGHTLAVVTEKGRVRLWDTGTGRQVGAEFGSGVEAVEFSPGGRRLVLDRGEPEWLTFDLEVWDVARQVVLHRTHSSRRLVAFSPDDRLAAYFGLDSDTVVWDLVSAKKRRTLGTRSAGSEAINTDTLGIAFSPDGKYLAVAGHSSGPRLWDLDTGQVFQDRYGVDGYSVNDYDGVGVAMLRFSSDGRFLAGFDDDRAVCLWRVADHTLLQRYKPAYEEVFDFRFTSDASSLRLVGDGGAVLTLDLRADTHPAIVKEASLSRDGSTVVSMGETTTLLDSRSREPIGSIPNDAFDTLEVGPGARIVALQKGSRVTLTKPAGQAPVVFELPGKAPYGRWQYFLHSMTFSPDGKSIAFVTGDDTKPRQTVLLYDVATGRQLHSIKVDHIDRPTGALAFQPGGHLLALGTYPGHAIDLTSGEILPERFGPETNQTSTLAFSPGGDLIAVGGNDGQVTFWDATTFSRVGLSLRGHKNGVDSLAFSSRDDLLAVAADDGVRIWDVASRHQLGLLLTTPGDDVTFAPDGSVLYTTGRTENEETWISAFPTDPEQAVATLCARVGTTLSREEWTRLIPESSYREICPKSAAGIR
ncbi:AAA family ATPase [Streptosporangium sp. NPDC049644]|uniref:caspase, EACC1-associated type n=1 Tax=Streptosporangium sp. NPDC049644 TaxID=3155507 RepID=UPI003429FA7F